MGKQSNLTVKGQVTIPKDVRDALGLKPGEPVAFAWNGAGEAVIRRGVRHDEGYAARYQAALQAIRETNARYPALPMPETTDEYMAMIREPVPLPNPDDLH